MDRVGILIVEDEQTQRSLLGGLLRKEGYTVGEASDGKAPSPFSKRPTRDRPFSTTGCRHGRLSPTGDKRDQPGD
jgi:hypothetical protein